MKDKIKVGDTVLVYDRYRFAIPLKAVVNNFSDFNDAVKVTLLESNSGKYPIGSGDVWIHYAQLCLVKKQPEIGPGGIGID